MKGAIRTFPIHLFPMRSQLAQELKGERLGGCTEDEHRLQVTLIRVLT